MKNTSTREKFCRNALHHQNFKPTKRKRKPKSLTETLKTWLSHHFSATLKLRLPKTRNLIRNLLKSLIRKRSFPRPETSSANLLWRLMMVQTILCLNFQLSWRNHLTFKKRLIGKEATTKLWLLIQVLKRLKIMISADQIQTIKMILLTLTQWETLYACMLPALIIKREKICLGMWGKVK